MPHNKDLTENYKGPNPGGRTSEAGYARQTGDLQGELEIVPEGREKARGEVPGRPVNIYRINRGYPESGLRNCDGDGSASRTKLVVVADLVPVRTHYDRNTVFRPAVSRLTLRRGGFVGP
jgi:hypothetical protein